MLSLLYGSTLTPIWKTIGLTTWTFTWMSVLFNTLSRFVIAFLPRSKRLLLRGMAHSFSQLDKAVVRVISLVSFL